jgi:PPIC-type PPIASE domain/SurA-like N-terminal domain
MTFRTRSAPQPSRRRVRRSDSRRTIYITLSFSMAIAIALSMLGAVFAAGYYSDHWAPIAGVNGEAISKDAVNERAHVNLARYNREIADYTSLRNQGKITGDEFSSIQSNLTNNESTLFTDALKQLENEATIRQWAAKNGISVTSQQVDDQITKDATIQEMRHVMIIGVAPAPVAPAYAVTKVNEQAAQTRAQGLLDEVNNGKAWADVQTEAQGIAGSTGVSSDVGLTSKAALSLDPDLVDAIFALAKPNDVTTLFKGSDGVYRFATVTSIVPAYVDDNWESSISSTASGSGYRAEAEAEALRTAVQNDVEKKYISDPTTQRHVLEISVSPGYGQPGDGDEVKISVIVFSPSGDESNASSVPTTDPAWAEAKTRADAALAKLQANPSVFDSMARDKTVNDDQYWNSTGGSIPWIPADLFNDQTLSGSTGLGTPNVMAAVFAQGVQPGQFLGPIQEPSEGWVVVEFQGRRPAPLQRIAEAQFAISSGVDFGTEASKISEVVDASNGGDLGWVSRYQLDDVEEQAIFNTPVGQVTPMVDDNGYHIYKVLEEQTRTQDAATQARLKQVVFPRWLADLEATSLIWTDQAAVTDLASMTP